MPGQISASAAPVAKLLLYSGPLSMFGAKAQIALHEKALPFELVMVPFDMHRLYEPKHPDVLRVNPKRQVPVLIHGAVEIFDSTQIFEYLEDLTAQPPLWPSTRRRMTNSPGPQPTSSSVSSPVSPSACRQAAWRSVSRSL